MIDTHCHLNFDYYDEDRDTVVKRAAAAGVDHIIVPGVDIDSSKQAIALTEKHPGIYCGVGIHPNNTANFNEAMLGRLGAFSEYDKVIAVGEIGLDYYWDKSPKAIQKQAFEAQLELAAKLELPVIIHNRDASEDVLGILASWVTTLPPTLVDRPGVLHSFSASEEIAQRALALGFYLGFTGPITFKKANDLRRIVGTIPQDRILVETDGPFLTPVPYRGKRNEPAYIPYIVERLAAIQSISDNEMDRITTTNANVLFSLMD